MEPLEHDRRLVERAEALARAARRVETARDALAELRAAEPDLTELLERADEPELAGRAALALEGPRFMDGRAARQRDDLTAAQALSPRVSDALTVALGRALMRCGDFAAAATAFAAIGSDAPAELAREASARLRTARVALGEAAEGPETEPELSFEHMAEAYACWWDGRSDDALDAVDRALEACWREEDVVAEVQALRQRAAAELEVGFLDAALHSADEAHALASQIGDRWSSAILDSLAASILLCRGDVAATRERLDPALEELGARCGAAFEGAARVTLGDCALLEGDLDGALATYDQASRTLGDAVWGVYDARIGVRRALVSARRGHADRALRRIDAVAESLRAGDAWRALVRVVADRAEAGDVARLERAHSDAPSGLRPFLALAPRPERRDALRLATDGSWVETASGLHVVRAPGPLSRILLALTEAPRTRPELLDAGWPGEKILPAAARNRVNVSISRLRSLGVPIAHDGNRWSLEIPAELVPA